MTQLDLINFFSPIFFSFEFLSFCLFMISTIVLFDYLSRYLCSNITFFYFFFIYLHILKALLFKSYLKQNILFFNNFKSKGFIPFKNNKNFIFSNVFFFDFETNTIFLKIILISSFFFFFTFYFLK